MRRRNLIITARERNEIEELERNLDKFDNTGRENESLDASAEWEDYMNNETPKSHGRSRMKRFMLKLSQGKTIRPCSSGECYAWGNRIITSGNHKSMKFSKILTNDMYYLVDAAKITPSPKDCDCFFYQYINEYLKANEKFRLDFLKALFLNENILKKSEIEWFVENFEFEKEYDIITSDTAFKAVVSEHFRSFYDLSANMIKTMTITGKKSKKKTKRSITNLNNEYLFRFNSLMSCFNRQKLYAEESSEIRDTINLDPLFTI